MSPSGITVGYKVLTVKTLRMRHETKQYSLSCCNGFHAVLFLVFHLGSFSFIEAMEKEIINL